MLTIRKEQEGTTLTLFLEGRLDIETADQLNNEVETLPQDVRDLRVDMQRLEYVSSAGLRSLLLVAKGANAHGSSFACVNVPQLIRETFEMTKLTQVMGL